MKGLCTKYLGKRDEAYDLVKLGTYFSVIVEIKQSLCTYI